MPGSRAGPPALYSLCASPLVCCRTTLPSESDTETSPLYVRPYVQPRHGPAGDPLMATRRPLKTPPLARQAAELAVAVPQVIAHRLTRLARAGPAPSARDRQEFRRMGAEKAAAFAESWNAMATRMLEANQTLCALLPAGFGSPARPKAIRRVRRPSGRPCGHGHRPSGPGAGASVRRGEREAPEPHATPVSATPRPGGRGTGRGNARPKTASDPASRRRPDPIPFGGRPTRAGCRAKQPARLYFMGASRQAFYRITLTVGE